MVRDSYEKCAESVQSFHANSKSSEGKQALCFLCYLPSVFGKGPPLQMGKLRHVPHTILQMWMAQGTEVAMVPCLVLTKSVHYGKLATFRNNVCRDKGAFSVSH